jgi:fused signal recognition particle receptor
MSGKYLVAVVLLLSALWAGSALAKIERFKDEQGTLHIRNNAEGDPAPAKVAGPVGAAQPPLPLAPPVPGVQPPPPPPLAPPSKMVGRPPQEPVPEPEPDDSGDDETASEPDDPQE